MQKSKTVSSVSEDTPVQRGIKTMRLWKYIHKVAVKSQLPKEMFNEKIDFIILELKISKYDNS